MAKNTLNKKQDIEFLKESDALLRILYWFFAFPTREISLNDLSKSVGVSKTTANRIVTNFIEQGFLKKEVLGKIWRISCDLNHPLNTTMKISYNLTLIYNSGILDEIFRLIPNPKAVILFGSYRKGDDNEKSDIDIAIEVLDNKEVNIIPLGTLNQIGYRKNVPVNLHIFSRNKVDLNLFANIANGIILFGFLEVRV